MTQEEVALANEILGEAGQVPPAAAPVGVEGMPPVALEDAPVAPVPAAAPVETAYMPEPSPQMSPEDYRAMMDEAVAPLREQLTQQNAQPPSEQEQALAELKEQLGLTGLEEQNAQLKAALDAQEQRQAQETMQNAVTTFKAGKIENAEQIVMDEINRIAQTDPQEAQRLQMTPMMWDYIYQAKIGAAQPQTAPDPIVGTGNSQTAPAKSAFDRAAAGEKVSQIDFGKELLEMSR